jgi:hypothetical protein
MEQDGRHFETAAFVQSLDQVRFAQALPPEQDVGVEASGSL